MFRFYILPPIGRVLLMLVAILLLVAFSVPVMAQVTVPTTAPTVIHGGEILSNIVAWVATGFGTAIAAFATRAVYKLMQKMGIEVTDQQKAQLQAIIVNGINDAATKAESKLSSDGRLDANVKSKVIQDAVAYTQSHAADTIRALGLDPNSGQAVSAIRARIATALADPNTPTDPRITSEMSGGLVKQVG
jgi:hypothetical protein